MLRVYLFICNLIIIFWVTYCVRHIHLVVKWFVWVFEYVMILSITVSDFCQIFSPSLSFVCFLRGIKQNTKYLYTFIIFIIVNSY